MDMVKVDHHYFQPLWSIAGIIASLSFIYFIWIFVLKRRNIKFDERRLSPASSPPEVAGAWPIIGHLPQLIGSIPLHRILTNMSDKYGPIFMVQFGMYPTLIVSSWEMSKECFTTNDRLFATRPPSVAGKYLTRALFGFSMYGPYWREIRKISTLHLLSHKRLDLLKRVRYLEIDNCMRRLYGCWMEQNNQKRQNSTSGSVKVDMSQVFAGLSLNVVLKIIVGQTLFGKDGENEDRSKEGNELHKTIQKFFELAGATVVADVLSFFGWLDLDGQKKQMKKVAKDMDLIASKWLDEHRQKKRRQTERGGNHDAANDFMDVLMSVVDEEQDDLFFGFTRDTVIKATCLQLIVAASDTTSVALTWALASLLTNPNVLKKAQDELDTIVGKDRIIEGRDINDLIYLQAIVKETLRLYPPTPLLVPHEAMEDCTVGGYELRAGTRLLVNVWKLHRDPRVWSNPSEFKPERFLQQPDAASGSNTANVDFRGQHFEFTPFGSGRRLCPGIDFFLQTAHMALARLLHAFDFDTAGGPAIDMAEGPGLTMPKVTPLEVHLHPRLPVTLYN